MCPQPLWFLSPSSYPTVLSWWFPVSPTRQWALWGQGAVPFLFINILWTINWGDFDYVFVKIKSILNFLKVTHIFYILSSPPPAIPFCTQFKTKQHFFLNKTIREEYIQHVSIGSKPKSKSLFRWLCLFSQTQKVSLSSVAKPFWIVYFSVTFD